MAYLFPFFFFLAALPVHAVENNDFYDNEKTFELAVPPLTIAGEVENPGPVDFTKLPVRSLMARETEMKNGFPGFTGAYRYDGYSLFDILKESYLSKKNKQEFPPIIDLMVIVENKKGDKVVLSWGEIFYPTSLHRIIIAKSVSPIIPSKTKEQWPIPPSSKLICGNDLLTVRNISDPIRITVISNPHSFPVQKDLSPLYASKVRIFEKEKLLADTADFPQGLETRTYPTVFFGRGKGFHGLEQFNGRLLKEILAPYYSADPENLKKGYLTLVGADGYRVSVTASELFNRNDYSEYLFIDAGSYQDGGRFKVYPAYDFFSDRAVKGLSEIRFDLIK
ncbi:MAG: hypothetical protein PHW04_00195 [Candidatus Wallbacteria bacterium]|nr:hypothetical protein [Candidatus Wallbacteria bacterium]